MSQGQRHVEPGQLLVVVGVDGSRAAQQAVRWAAIEARMRAATLLIVHVEPLAADVVGADRPGHAGILAKLVVSRACGARLGGGADRLFPLPDASLNARNERSL